MTLKRLFRSVVLPIMAYMTLAAAAFPAAKNISDDFLTDTIRQKLAADQIVKGGAIDVEVHDGAVVLKGKVEEEKQKVRAEKVAKKVHGVKTVRNDIQLARP
jgi:hyperosmotically inducible protein